MQALDAQADQARHRRNTLPEHAEIASLTGERAKLDAQLRDARVAVDDLTLAQQKADADVEQVKARRTRDQQRMDAGLIANPKDLQRMQEELVSLNRRISVLEDAELEVMEQLEDAQRNLDDLTAKVEATDERLAALDSSRTQKAAEIDEELTRLEQQRATMIADLPADLLGLYDRLRGQKGGVGAAEIRARQCGGCMLSLDASEVARIKAAPVDEVVRCEECSRILVRTSESGL